jgi:hypothetical protein
VCVSQSDTIERERSGEGAKDVAATFFNVSTLKWRPNVAVLHGGHPETFYVDEKSL